MRCISMDSSDGAALSPASVGCRGMALETLVCVHGLSRGRPRISNRLARRCPAQVSPVLRSVSAVRATIPDAAPARCFSRSRSHLVGHRRIPPRPMCASHSATPLWVCGEHGRALILAWMLAYRRLGQPVRGAIFGPARRSQEVPAPGDTPDWSRTFAYGASQTTLLPVLVRLGQIGAYSVTRDKEHALRIHTALLHPGICVPLSASTGRIDRIERRPRRRIATPCLVA